MVIKNSQNFLLRLLKGMLYLINSEVAFRLEQLAHLGILPTVCYYLKSVLNQRYTGDITIAHSLGIQDYWTMFSPAEYQNVLSMIARGEKATLPFIDQISDQLRIENLINEIVVRFEKELESNGHNSVHSSLENLSLINK